VFPPSDSHSLENSSESYSQNANGSNGGAGGNATNGTATIEDRRGHELMPYGGGMMASGGMPWSFGPMRPEILTATPTFSNLMHALRRRLWLATFSALVLGGLLGYAAWRLMPTKFESMAVLQVKITAPVVWNQHSEGEADFVTYKANTASIVKAGFVLNKALDDRTVRDLQLVKDHGTDAVAWLHDSLVIKNDPGSELIQVSLLNEDPQGLPEIVNAVVNAYQHEVVEKGRTEKLVRKDQLDKKFRAYQTTVLDKERKLFELNTLVGTTDAETAKVRIRIELADLESLMQSRSEAQKAIGELKMKIALLKVMIAGANNGQVPEDKIEDAIARDPQIIQAQNDLNALQREEREIRRVVKNPNNDPSMVRIRDAIRVVQQSMEEMRNTDRQKLIDSIKRDNDQGGSSMKSLEVQQSLYQEQFDNTAKQIADKAESVQKLEKFNGDADQLRTEISQLQTIVNEMGNTLTQWAVELDAPERVTIREPAGAARAVEPYKQYAMAGFGGLLGFGLALAGATFYEFFSRRLNSATDVAEGLGIRVMGDLPALRRRRMALRARSRKAVHGLVAESINSIRAALVRNSEPGSCNVYLVTSAAEQEGKTTVASQLAASLARSGRRTLLVDCDLRHPGAHLVFGVPNEYGFSELLRGEVHVDDAIRPTPADNLWMITAGRCCAQAVLMLGKDALGDIFSQLESRFDFVVIDAGPVLKVADPMLLGQYVDGAILSVLRDVSQIHKVYEASERLKLAGVKVVGAVINGVDDRGAFDRYNVELPAA
jgi:polysaccharide biosynthesis transport protein